MKRLDGMDAMFLHTETATQYMHTLKVAIFDPAVDGTPYRFADQFAHIASTLHRVPPFRWRAVNLPFNLHNPVWINDPDFDLALHVHRAALPAPGGPGELAEFVENIASTPLNRDRALWELWMVENYQGDRIAAVAKVHHALADGMATAEMLEDFMTPEPAHGAGPDSSWQPEKPPPGTILLLQALRDLLVDLAKIPGQIARIRQAKRRSEARKLAQNERAPEPYSAPFTSLNGPISSRRKFCFFTLPLADVKEVNKAFGVTINDVVMTLAAEAVRELLIARGDLPQEPLTASIPISTRGEEAEHSYGNKVGSLCVSLCTDVENPATRLPAIHEAMALSRQDFEDTAGGRIADFIGRKRAVFYQ